MGHQYQCLPFLAPSRTGACAWGGLGAHALEATEVNVVPLSMLELNMQAFCCPPYGQPNDQQVGRPGSCTVARRAARVIIMGHDI